MIVEDDADDKHTIEEAVRELGMPNETRWFKSCIDALAYLKTTNEQPFIILCDVNLPMMDGVKFKTEIDSDPVLKRKSVPFVFFSTSADKGTVDHVYTRLTVQGYFQKANTYRDTMNVLKTILLYWKVCKHPNSA